MKKYKVKIFYAYFYDDEGDEYYKQFEEEMGYLDVFDFHTHIVDDDGYVWCNNVGIKPRPQDIREVYKYELTAEERAKYEEYSKNIQKAEELLKNANKTYTEYIDSLLASEGIEAYEDTAWECSLSPFGYCMYSDEAGEEECVFCGEPEERK